MHNEARENLRRVMGQFGPSICDNPPRCEAILRDYLGNNRKEIFVLVSALKSGAVDALRRLDDSQPVALLMPSLAWRLEDDFSLSPDAAKWAIETWAIALGLFQPAVKEPQLSPTAPKPSSQQAPAQSAPAGEPWSGNGNMRSDAGDAWSDSQNGSSYLPGTPKKKITIPSHQYQQPPKRSIPRFWPIFQIPQIFRDRTLNAIIFWLVVITGIASLVSLLTGSC